MDAAAGWGWVVMGLWMDGGACVRALLSSECCRPWEQTQKEEERREGERGEGRDAAGEKENNQGNDT